MASLTAADLDYLRRHLGLHSLGRIAVNPDAELARIRQSMLGGLRHDYSFQVDKTGLRITPKDGDEYVVRWRDVRAHVDRYVSDEWRADFRRIDYYWCRVKSGHYEKEMEPRGGDDPLGYSWLLDAIIATQARPVWTPEATIDTEAEQLGLFAS